MNQEQREPWRRTYGGYHNAIRPLEDAELTHTGRGTPCGEYLRRFWQPVALVSQVKDVPLKIRIMGEDLVLFRDRSKRLGLLHAHCAHRGTSLEYGIPLARGLRCCYHGWAWDIDGTCLETPGEPPHSRLRETVFQGAYPAREYCGLVFAYMGPPDQEPDFPRYDSLEFPADNEYHAYSLAFPCNWLQSHENGADPVHASFLHTISSGVQFTPAFGELAVCQYTETPLGMISSATRRIGDNLWIRGSDVIAPNSAQFGSSFVDGHDIHYAVCSWVTRWVVPVDDDSNITIGVRLFNSLIDPERKGKPDEIGLHKVDFAGQTPARPYHERQREPGDFEAQVGQGGVARHAAENLGTTDKGVLMTRRFLRAGIRAVQEGKPFKRPTLNRHGVCPTYNHQIVHCYPKRNDRDDADVLTLFGRRVAEMIVAKDDMHPVERQRAVEREIRAEF
ncbi:MAG: Rieske 2Fe-2S domain-containing protein [Alphaproteobacteria bacterium]|nr:Rieske 2Fe-2S domain-containing protein [Alphaproteobacteria bacterium]